MKHIVVFASFPNIRTVADLQSVRNKCVEHAVVKGSITLGEFTSCSPASKVARE